MGHIVDDKEKGIIYEEWKRSRPRAALVLVHGLGACTSRWNFLAEFFLSRSISSYAIMLKGFGKTPGPRGHVDSFNIYIRDVRELCEIAKKENPGLKVFALGESMGALISFIASGLYPDLFDGLVCFSPAFGNKLKFSVPEFINIFLSYVFNKKRQFNLPFDSGMCTRDEEHRKVMDNDPDELRAASSALLVGIAAAQLRYRSLAAGIKKPVLFLLAGDDMLVDNEASLKVFKALSVKDKTIKHYPEMRHALSVDLGRENVFNDAFEWLEQKL
ncbi:MAG: lysophospholipase [Candidatus Omnitrophota bacterium]|jgi:lysophospholipase